MSPTTDDLRRRMEAELDDFPTLPDLTESALTGGRQRRRHRRLTGVAAGSVLAALAVVPVLLLAVPQDAPDRASRPTDVATDPTAPVDAQEAAREQAAGLRTAAESDGVVTEAEWDDAVVATLDALLPPRFRGVDRTANDAVVMVRTRAGSPQLDLWMAVTGYAGDRSIQPGHGGCPQVEEAAARSDADWDILDCSDARFGNGFQALGTSERIVGGQQSDSYGVETYAGALLLLHDRLFVEVGIKPVGVEAPLSVTTDELVALAQDPDFLDLVRVGVAHARDRTDPEESAFERVDPVWPG